jgi:hypothetical protein
MRTWWTGKPCEYTQKSHINFCVFDSTWEATETFELDRNPNVEAWVKNDHLGFEILYVFKGVVHKYQPDFIIQLKTGSHLILEVKGQDTQQDRTKREFLDEWVRAVDEHGGFGKWQWAVSTHPSDVAGILQNARTNKGRGIPGTPYQLGLPHIRHYVPRIPHSCASHSVGVPCFAGIFNRSICSKPAGHRTCLNFLPECPALGN